MKSRFDKGLFKERRFETADQKNGGFKPPLLEKIAAILYSSSALNFARTLRSSRVVVSPVTLFSALVPKLCLGTHLSSKLCFAARWENKVFKTLAFPNSVWERGKALKIAAILYSSSALSFARTLRSSRVVVSPVTLFPLATSFSKRRMIFPLRVFGSASAKRISSGFAIAPICVPT